MNMFNLLFHVMQQIFRQFCDMVLRVSKIIAYFANQEPTKI